ncbi:efflux RND transporter periplasmic adaptor subunit [Carboxylicivirga marina]|uniref:Efflux RND transporter periplasmic adaptor subunit n=1 Tax=Carboxylicivirga marina TaxID=2800988 RepID=A0ABS1HLT2_9BACT|nr:efflux RND transporter periplasmic adaptor subunit [Carboxylicivirga marina]MBK3518618.1 efflux RND transporter periplasmic adaptor subunit [Carboxylicivirga marina]
MKKIVKIFISVLFVGLVIFGFVYLYNKSKVKDIIYETKNPSVDNVIQKTVATGSVTPRKEILIKPQVSGIIAELYVEPGDHVKKNDLLAKIKIIPDMVALNAAESRLNKAKLRLEDAQLVYDRQKGVFEQGVIAEAEFQNYRIDYNTALEEVEAAENNLQLIKEGITKKSGEITNTLIRSTIEGMVLDVPVEVGTSVIQTNTFNEGTTIASVADMNEMIFEGKIDETEVGKIKEGMKLELTIGAIEEEKFDAELEYISPKGVEENGAVQFEIKAKVKLSSSNFIRAGYSANANIVLDRRDSVLTVSESLILFENENKDSIYVEIETAPQVFEKRFISTGLSDGIKIEIKEGLTKKDKVKVPQAS